MIGIPDQMQRRRRPEAGNNRFKQRRFCKGVTGALQKQHRDMNIGEMFRPIAGRLARRMQRKTQERKPMDAGQRRNCLRLRRHAAAERFAARDQREPRAVSPGFRDRGAHGGLRHRRRIGPLAGFFHIRELIAQRRHVSFAKAGGNRLHEWMDHAGARAMGKDKARPRLRRPHQESGDGAGISGFDDKCLRADCVHSIRNP
jgi:hypothetical protein